MDILGVLTLTFEPAPPPPPPYGYLWSAPLGIQIINTQLSDI